MYNAICLTDGEASETSGSAVLATVLADTFEAELQDLVTESRVDRVKQRARLLHLLPESVRARYPMTQDASPPTGDGTEDLEATHMSALLAALDAGDYDLAVLPAWSKGEDEIPGGIGALCERLVRRVHMDAFVVKFPETAAPEASGNILVAIDGSAQSYAGLKQALELGKRFGKAVEAIAVYDPYIHYTLFNGIVNVLTEEASRVFKFADQEKLHEEIIDTGLAKIYQAHLEVARRVANEAGHALKTILLDGKAFQKVLRHCQKTNPWLLVLGRVGVHSDATMDIGSTCENLLRTVPCNVLVTSSEFTPPVDVTAEASIQWTDAAKWKMDKVPSFVRGVATTAILRWALEHGHSVITPSVVNSAMGDLLPSGAAQAMGYVAEELAKKDLHDGQTFICPECGYAARDFRPTICSVCGTSGTKFEQINREIIEQAGELEKGALIVEETFDGKKLVWTADAKEVLRRVPSGYERRRAKARIEKTARVRKLDGVDKAFAVEMIEQEMADNAYLSKKGEHLEISVKEDERAQDELTSARPGAELPWTDAAWQRVLRIPEGFMRDMTIEKIEAYTRRQEHRFVNLTVCEEGIEEGRRLMAEMLGQYSSGKASDEAVKESFAAPSSEASVAAESGETVASPETSEATKGWGCPVDHSNMPPRPDSEPAPTSAEAVKGAKCPVDHSAMESSSAVETKGACPVAHDAVEETGSAPDWTEGAEEKLNAAVERVSDTGKFEEDRARELSKGAAEERAKERRMDAIGSAFMGKLGDQLGYGHPLAEATADYDFEWTPEAEARLEAIPEFCREMTRWRVEWTAVKLELGTTITPEVMDAKYDMWNEVSENILNRGGSGIEWDQSTLDRLAKIPDFVKGQVIQSVEGNAQRMGVDRVTDAVLDSVIDKWIRTGDFHEGQFGYK